MIHLCVNPMHLKSAPANGFIVPGHFLTSESPDTSYSKGKVYVIEQNNEVGLLEMCFSTSGSLPAPIPSVVGFTT